MKSKWVMLWDVKWTDHVADVGGKEFNSFAEVKKPHAKKSVKLRSATWSLLFEAESTRTTVTP